MAFPINSAIWEYLQSVDRLTHAVQLGRLLSHLARYQLKIRKAIIHDNRYLGLPINTLPATERRLITFLFRPPDAIDVWRHGTGALALCMKMRVTVALLRVEGRVNPGMGGQHDRSAGNNVGYEKLIRHGGGIRE